MADKVSYDKVIDFIDKNNGHDIENWSIKKGGLEDVFESIHNKYDLNKWLNLKILNY